MNNKGGKLMKLNRVQEVVEKVMKALEDVNYQANRKICNQTKVNKAYDILFDFRKEIIKEKKGETKDE